MAEAVMTVDEMMMHRPSTSSSGGATNARRLHRSMSSHGRHHHQRRRRHHSSSAASSHRSSQRTQNSTNRGTMTDDLSFGRRNGVRERDRWRRNIAVATDGLPPDEIDVVLPPRNPHPFLDDGLHPVEVGLDDAIAWDAGRFVAVLRQRHDLFFGMTDDDLLNVLIADDGMGGGERPEPTYPVGAAMYAECVICLDWKNLHSRVCCGIAACDECLRQYVTMQVSQAIIKIQCIGTCEASMHRDEILARLDNADKARYVQFLVDANVDPLRRTCPRCNYISAVEGVDLASAGKLGLQVTCPECKLEWCFPCHAPWHAEMRCSDFRRGDKLLKAWAREQHFGQVNAQKCPKCKFYIQRSSGCDHMTCSRCKTDFCYRCGERFRELKFVGNHYSKLSIFGCKYRFKPTQPVQRRLIRGSIFAAQLLAVPALAALAVGAGAVVAGVGSLVLPFYAGYKLHKRLERHRSAKRRRRAREAMWHKLEDMRWRGEELDISHPMLTELDTTQIIRSFIGIDIAGGSGTVAGDSSAAALDGSALDGTSTTDDAHSRLDIDSDTDTSSDDDDEDYDDDYSLHIRDEACQTGEGDGMAAGCSHSASNYVTVSRKEVGIQSGLFEDADGLEELGGIGLPVDEELTSAGSVLSPWALLLNGQSSEDCRRCESDGLSLNKPEKVAKCEDKSVKIVGRSLDDMNVEMNGHPDDAQNNSVRAVPVPNTKSENCTKEAVEKSLRQQLHSQSEGRIHWNFESDDGGFCPKRSSSVCPITELHSGLGNISTRDLKKPKVHSPSNDESRNVGKFGNGVDILPDFVTRL